MTNFPKIKYAHLKSVFINCRAKINQTRMVNVAEAGTVTILTAFATLRMSRRPLDQHEVLRLHIPMNDAEGMEALKGLEQLSQD